MMDVKTLLRAIDAFKAASGIDADTTVSYRLFKDSAKVRALRAGADLTTSRFNLAMVWLLENWPSDAADQLPNCLEVYQKRQVLVPESAGAES
jgi:hypothetical protein